MARQDKATHCGHCQACNAVQKLPGGKLAKHGYTVRHSFFLGVCFGSGHLPLEQDKQIVVQSIQFAQQRIHELGAMAAIWSKPTGEHFAWFHEYVPADWRNRHSSYRWVYAPVGRQCLKYSDGSFRTEGFAVLSGKMEPLLRYSIHGTTAEIVKALNDKYVADLERSIKDAQSYIREQQHRIKVWHQQPLLNLEGR